MVNDGLGVFVGLHRTVKTGGSVRFVITWMFLVYQIAVKYEKLMD